MAVASRLILQILSHVSGLFVIPCIFLQEPRVWCFALWSFSVCRGSPSLLHTLPHAHPDLQAPANRCRVKLSAVLTSGSCICVTFCNLEDVKQCFFFFFFDFILKSQVIRWKGALNSERLCSLTNIGMTCPQCRMPSLSRTSGPLPKAAHCWRASSERWMTPVVPSVCFWYLHTQWNWTGQTGSNL